MDMFNLPPGASHFFYSREELLGLKTTAHAGIRHHIPAELRRRYRGCKAGAKLKAKLADNRRRFKPSIPSIIMGNVNSLPNKIDELSALNNQRTYRESSLYIFTETWLNHLVPDANVDLPGFTVVRADRDANACGKSRGGGLIIYINHRWCSPGHVTVKEVLCCPDLELLAVSLRPYYIPREFSHVIALCVYIPPSADAAVACEKIHTVTARLQTQHPEAFIIISGDFNHATLDSTLAAFYQAVDCPTRNNKTIDLLYTNVRDAYRATPLPPLGKSDHNLVHLQPQYTPLVQRQSNTTRSIRKWSSEVEDALRDCFEATDWDVLLKPHGEDIEGQTHCLTDYLNFCLDVVTPAKTVRCYPNNKPWVTQEVKAVLNRKKVAFRSKDREAIKSAQREVKQCLKEAKNNYRRKVEHKLSESRMREVWDGVNTITGHRVKTVTARGSVEEANRLNNFFNRFDQHTTLPPSLQPPPPPPLPPVHLLHNNNAVPFSPLPSPHPSPCITADQVRGELRKLHPRKAAGPDKVSPRLLKTCAAELGEPLQHVFNLSLQLGKVPTLWKTSCIVPVPKKNRPSELNDFRPVALTSQLMKTLERLFLNLLRPQVQHAQDPLQFAYRAGVGVEDAILYLLHRAHSHLDKGGGTVRILFLDFSSAFNTIQPLMLQDKLLRMQVDPCLVSWISNYLTDRPQYVRLTDTTSDTVVSSTGAPQGTVLAPLLFTLYTSDFCYSSELCHIQKFADDTVIMGCIRDDREEEYRSLVNDFVVWSQRNHLHLNTSKTKELVMDFGKSRPCPRPVLVRGDEVEVVGNYKYLGVWLDNKLDWSCNSEHLYKRGQCRLYFLRRLRSFNICRKLLQMFYQSVVASALFYAVVCWGGSTSTKHSNRLDKLIRRASSVVGTKLDSLVTVAERRSRNKLLAIMDNASHPLQPVISAQKSLLSDRLLLPRCRTNRFKDSFVPRAIKLYNSALGGRGRSSRKKEGLEKMGH
uniref:Reverse transcriptase domain-containing protein n=1 Tax=Echeneis naucrates TaxID=173247 RepID=A0A665T724_ECHNA